MGAARRAHRLGEPWRRYLVQVAILECDIAWQCERICPAFGFPVRLFRRGPLAARGRHKAKEIGALVALRRVHRNREVVGVAGASEIVPEIERLCRCGYPERVVLQLADDVGRTVFATALKREEEDVVDLGINFIAEPANTWRY